MFLTIKIRKEMHKRMDIVPKTNRGKLLWEVTKQVTRFIQAARVGNVKEVIECIEQGIDPNTMFDGTTIVHTCVEMQHKVMFLAVLSKAKYINLNVQNELGETALMMACKQQIDPRFIQILLKYGADPNISNKKERTPLHEAVIHKWIIIVQKLLKAGADINAMDVFGSTPLSLACIVTRFLPMVKCLIKHKADPNQGRGLERPFFLHFCLSIDTKNDLDIVEFLMGNGVDPQLEDPISKSNALHCAVTYDNYDLTMVLLRFFVDVEKVNAAGMTPIRLAKHFKHYSLAIALEEHLHYINMLKMAEAAIGIKRSNKNIWNRVKHITTLTSKSKHSPDQGGSSKK